MVAPTARPFTYDFRRTLLSGTVISIILITVVLSVALVPFLRSAESTVGIASSNVAGVDYYSNSTGVNVIVYSFNQFGQPISGTQLNVTAQSGSAIRHQVASTNSSGYASIAINLPYPPATVGPGSVNSLTVNAGGTGYAMPFPPASGIVNPIFSFITPVFDPINSSRVDVAVFYAAPLGAPPTGYGVYYAINSGGYLNQSSMTPLGTMSGYFQRFSFPTNANITAADTVSISIFDPSGILVSSSGTSGYFFQSASLVQQLSTVQSLVSSFVGGLFGLFVPLMAILAAYNTYGKDKVSGVLESVLARPVSRRGLSISRFTSTSLAMVVAIILSVAVLDFVVYFLAHFFLTPSFVGTVIATLSVEAVAFVGIMFVLSRLIRSGGALVGVGVGLWAILDFFWSIIILLLAYLLNYGFGSAAYYGLSVYSSFFNPAQFYGLVNSLNSSSISGFSFTPTAYGINVFTVTATGILWIAIPFAIFLYLAIRRD